MILHKYLDAVRICKAISLKYSRTFASIGELVVYNDRGHTYIDEIHSFELLRTYVS